MRSKDFEKQDRIKKVMIRLILRDGIDGMSISKIAKEAGVSSATIYVYYESAVCGLSGMLDMTNEERYSILAEDSRGKRTEQIERIIYEFIEVGRHATDAMVSQQKEYREKYKESAIKRTLAHLQRELDEMHPENVTDAQRFAKDFLTGLSWKKEEAKEIDLDEARRILDEDHYGLKKVKERIVQQIAVMNLKKRQSGSILLFVGAPGTGKTSIGRSIARALGREYVRVSLGGVHMNRTSGDIGEPTSGRCRGASWTPSIKAAFPIPSWCWTRWISCRIPSTEAPPARFWRFLTRSGTTPSPTTT